MKKRVLSKVLLAIPGLQVFNVQEITWMWPQDAQCFVSIERFLTGGFIVDKCAYIKTNVQEVD